MISTVFTQCTLVGLFQASVSEPNSVTLKVEAACSFRMLGQSYYTMWCKAQKTTIWTSIGDWDVTVKGAVLWDVMCSWVDRYRWSRGGQCLHLQLLYSENGNSMPLWNTSLSAKLCNSNAEYLPSLSGVHNLSQNLGATSKLQVPKA
jgi:hypothetical protein